MKEQADSVFLRLEHFSQQRAQEQRGTERAQAKVTEERQEPCVQSPAGELTLTAG